jgi:hypothetical protein
VTHKNLQREAQGEGVRISVAQGTKLLATGIFLAVQVCVDERKKNLKLKTPQPEDSPPPTTGSMFIFLAAPTFQSMKRAPAGPQVNY